MGFRLDVVARCIGAPFSWILKPWSPRLALRGFGLAEPRQPAGSPMSPATMQNDGIQNTRPVDLGFAVALASAFGAEELCGQSLNRARLPRVRS